MDNAFLGKGWSFPPRFDTASGSVMMREHAEDVRESVGIILGTRLGERVMRPDFGSRVPDLVFQSPGPSDLASLERDLLFVLGQFEPRIYLERVQILEDEQQPGLLLFEIEYRLRATNSRFNLVYPFYLNEATRLP